MTKTYAINVFSKKKYIRYDEYERTIKECSKIIKIETNNNLEFKYFGDLISNHGTKYVKFYYEDGTTNVQTRFGVFYKYENFNFTKEYIHETIENYFMYDVVTAEFLLLYYLIRGYKKYKKSGNINKHITIYYFRSLNNIFDCYYNKNTNISDEERNKINTLGINKKNIYILWSEFNEKHLDNYKKIENISISLNSEILTFSINDEVFNVPNFKYLDSRYLNTDVANYKLLEIKNA